MVLQSNDTYVGSFYDLLKGKGPCGDLSLQVYDVIVWRHRFITPIITYFSKFLKPEKARAWKNQARPTSSCGFTSIDILYIKYRL
jgi:hypothetical protein